MAHSCTAPARGQVAETPEPSAGTGQSLGQVHKHRRCWHSHLQRRLSKRLQVPLVCFCSSSKPCSTLERCCPGCRWCASRRARGRQAFFQAGQAALLLSFSMQLFLIKKEGSRYLLFHSKVKLCLLNTALALQLKVFAAKARLIDCLSLTQSSSCCIMKCC